MPIKYNYADIGIKAGDVLYFYFQHNPSIVEEHQNEPPMTVIVLDPIKKYVKIMGNEYSTVNKFLVENNLLKSKHAINAPGSLYTEADHFSIKGYNWCLANYKGD